MYVCTYMFVFNIPFDSHLIVYTIKNHFKNTFID